MADCKQCLHYEVCADMAEKFIDAFSRGVELSVICKNFKDSTKWITRRQAKWIPINTIDKWRYQCDCCKHYVDAGTDRNYCPNCGCEMVK